MTPLVHILYSLSTALLVPTIVLLLGLVAWSLLELGGFVGEFVERRRRRAAWDTFVKRFRIGAGPDDTRAALFFETTDYPGFTASFAARGRAVRRDALHLGKLAADLETEAAGRLARMSLGVRVGPILGLMGTLIPMGPALIGLSSGDIDTMARNLVVAFSTTVLGLVVGGLCYCLLVARRQWYSRDLSNVEYVYRCLHEGSTGTDGSSANPPGSDSAVGPSTTAGHA